MKKTWNSPEVQELTIQATAFGYSDDFGYYSRRPDKDKKPGDGKSDMCRCEGGTSPCSKHHNWNEDFES